LPNCSAWLDTLDLKEAKALLEELAREDAQPL
jgi:hypothetical protein